MQTVGVWRFAYAFDPERKGIILIGGDKSGVNQKKFYKKLIKQAEERYENVKVIDQFCTLEFDGVPIDIVPWICDDNEKEILEQMNGSKSQICFGHFEVIGFQSQKGVINEVGVEKNIFAKYDVVLSGHFHMKSNDGQIFYVGTPYEMMWSDYGDQKGFHIFDTQTRNMEYIQNNFHMFNKITYDDGVNDFEYWKNYDFESLKNSYVKVIVVNKQNPYLFDTVIDSLYKKGVADISIVEDFNDSLFEEDQEIIDQAEDTLTIINRVIDVTNDVKDPNILKSIIKELYLEALNVEQHT